MMLIKWKDLSSIRKILTIFMFYIGAMLAIGSFVTLLIFEVIWLAWIMSIAALCTGVLTFFVGKMGYAR